MQRSVPRARLADAATVWESDIMQFRHLVLLCAPLSLGANTAFAGGSDFRFDTVHTQISVCLEHMGFSHSCGRLHLKSGFFHFDADDWSTAKVDALVDTGSLDMGDAAWSDKVRSAYLDTHTYPTAHYASTRVEKTGERSGIVHGTLTLLGRTQPVDLALTFNRAGADGYTMHYVAGFSATAQFKRSAFGSTRSAPDVGDRIDVRIEAEGLRDKDAREQASAHD
jgi:polyisoprenoid-binding protein YceI